MAYLPYRRTWGHPLHVPISEKNPDGITTRNTGCRKNPTRGKRKTVIQDYLHPNEIHAIADQYFKNLSGPPASGRLSEFSDADKFDAFIRGWTQYWNEVLNPTEPLDPDLVKALIATESSFKLKPPAQNAGAAGKARGLIQLTDQAIRALKDPNGELKDHLVEMIPEEASDPNVAISAGIRWLFHKKVLAANRLKREATWMEGIAEYKAYLKDMISGKDPNPKGMQKIQYFYRKLK